MTTNTNVNVGKVDLLFQHGKTKPLQWVSHSIQKFQIQCTTWPWGSLLNPHSKELRTFQAENKNKLNGSITNFSHIKCSVWGPVSKTVVKTMPEMPAFHVRKPGFGSQLRLLTLTFSYWGHLAPLLGSVPFIWGNKIDTRVSGFGLLRALGEWTSGWEISVSVQLFLSLLNDNKWTVYYI